MKITIVRSHGNQFLPSYEDELSAIETRPIIVSVHSADLSVCSEDRSICFSFVLRSFAMPCDRMES